MLRILTFLRDELLKTINQLLKMPTAAKKAKNLISTLKFLVNV